jgi:hypothetical protein
MAADGQDRSQLSSEAAAGRQGLAQGRAGQRPQVTASSNTTNLLNGGQLMPPYARSFSLRQIRKRQPSARRDVIQPDGENFPIELRRRSKLPGSLVLNRAGEHIQECIGRARSRTSALRGAVIKCQFLGGIQSGPSNGPIGPSI